eukprot:m.116645 g.116645  ORF g.116645 m.116645 type:complete len:68 (-) comp21637_c0_seq1:204-407(-)
MRRHQEVKVWKKRMGRQGSTLHLSSSLEVKHGQSDLPQLLEQPHHTLFQLGQIFLRCTRRSCTTTTA